MTLASKSTGGRPQTDYILTIDMAKEISMLSKTGKSKEVRRYFIDIEKKFKQNLLPQTYEQALEKLLETVKENNKVKVILQQKEEQLAIAQPKAEVADTFLKGFESMEMDN